MQVAHNVKFVHLALPNGTTSAGRNFHSDKCQLRNHDSPDGVPGLTGEALEAVTRENRVIAKLPVILDWCLESGILFSLESPASSLIWKTSSGTVAPSPLGCLAP